MAILSSRIYKHPLVDSAGSPNIDVIQDTEADLVGLTGFKKRSDFEIESLRAIPGHHVPAMAGVLAIDPKPNFVDDCRRHQPNRLTRSRRRNRSIQPIPHHTFERMTFRVDIRSEERRVGK